MSDGLVFAEATAELAADFTFAEPATADSAPARPSAHVRASAGLPAVRWGDPLNGLTFAPDDGDGGELSGEEHAEADFRY